MPNLPGFDLTGRLALVTGAAMGIGAGIAEVLADAGAHVLIADRALAEAEATATALRERGLQASAMALDVAEEQSVVNACAAAFAENGAPWVLVNNAGVQDRELLLEASVAEWDRVMGVNARGAFLMTREVAKAMIAAGQGGRIVNVGSGAMRGGIIKGLAAYTASKGALAGLTIQSAHELVEHGITVNNVLPGAVMTPGAINARGPAERSGPAARPRPLGFATPQDIGHAVLYFASPAAARVTNQELAVESGFSIA